VALAKPDRRMVRRLESVPLPLTVPLPAAYDAVRDRAMHQLGVGTTTLADTDWASTSRARSSTAL
jgi:hypothetical protein